MNPRTILQRHRALRWLAPVGVVGIAALAATGMFKQQAPSQTLPDTSPAALLAGVQTSHVDGFSGTVVSTLSLGLPDLPQIGDTGQGTSLTSLLTGSHTLQVWYGGAHEQRVALLGTTDETDVFRSGSSLWEWSSAERRAVHITLPKALTDRTAVPLPSDASSMTPPELARRALAAIDPSTSVRVGPGGTVADRSTYELVLTPRTTATRIGSVHIAVDGATKVPLAVKVYARGADQPAIDVAFTSVRFGRPAQRNFKFTPPAGARVRTVRVHGPAASPASPASQPTASTSSGQVVRAPKITVTGTGWSRVLGLTLPASAVKSGRRNALLDSLRPVSGPWGHGRVLESDLLSVLVTDDGRMFAGAVAPAALFAAAAGK